eukprot:459839-Rhodomonas_salina.1
MLGLDTARVLRPGRPALRVLCARGADAGVVDAGGGYRGHLERGAASGSEPAHRRARLEVHQRALGRRSKG